MKKSGLAMELEPHYHGLRDINERDGSFEADVSLRIAWSHEGEVAVPLTCPILLASSEHLSITEIEQTHPAPVSFWMPGWFEITRRIRVRSTAQFAMHEFPFDHHKLRVVFKIQESIDAISSINVKQQDRSLQSSPDLGLQDFFVLRSRAYLRTLTSRGQEVQRKESPPEIHGTESTSPRQTSPSSPQALSSYQSVAPDFSRSSTPEFVLEFQLQRRAIFWVTTVLLPLIAMEIFVLLSFAINPGDMPSKLMITSTILLTAVVFKSSLMDRLPTTGYTTLTDEKFVYVYVITLFASLSHTFVGLLSAASNQWTFQVNFCLATFIFSILVAQNLIFYNRNFGPYLKRVSLFVEKSLYTPVEVKISESWTT